MMFFNIISNACLKNCGVSFFRKSKLLKLGLFFITFLSLFSSTCVFAIELIGTTPDSASSPVGSDAPLQCDVENPGGCQGGASDVGSSPSVLQPRSGVGNPINLMSGNKFQSETDFSLPGSMLMFKRMYNSATTDSNVGMGLGWRHSYAVSIFDTGDGRREIVQSNGARLRFGPDGTDDNGNPLLRAVQGNHGYLVQQDNRHVWHLPDGRTLKFQGSFLVQIKWLDQRFLKLYYREKLLESVTDETGRVIVFAYTAWPDSELETYNESGFSTAAGHLETITLPDGSVIGYDYDDKKNLSRVRFPDGTHRNYHYEDEVYASHLTGLTDRTNVRFATWRYDEYGRAISSEHANGVEKITLRYPDPKVVLTGDIVVTKVINSTGQNSSYRWRQATGHSRPQLLFSEGAGCTTCPPTGFSYSYDESGRLLSRTLSGNGSAIGEGSYSYRYDVQGRLVETKRIDAAGVDRLIERVDYENSSSIQPLRKYLPSVKPGASRVVDMTYNEHGQLSTITESGFEPLVSLSSGSTIAASNTSSMGDMTSDIDSYRPIKRTIQLNYDNGRLVEIDGPRNDVEDITRLSWDNRHRLTEIKAPLSPVFRMSEFDANGQAQRIRIGDASSYKIERNIRGSVTAITHRGMRYEYQHDAEKRLIGISGPDGQQVTIGRDEAGRMVRTLDDVGRVGEFIHDSESRVISQNMLGIDGALVRSLSYVFDTKGRISESIEQRQQGADGLSVMHSLDYQYDSNNYLSGATDLLTGASVQVSIDHLQRMTTFMHSNGSNQSVKADVLGQSVGLRDQRSNITAFLRDDFGRVVFYDNPDTGHEGYQYNETGHRTVREREDGSITTYRWDAAGRLIEMRASMKSNVQASAILDIVKRRYDPKTGQLLEAQNAASTDQFTYNSDAQLISHTRDFDGKAFTTKYAYDSRGRQISKILPNGQTLQFSYHTEGPNKGSLRAISKSIWLGLNEQVLLSEIDLDARNGTSGYRTQNGRYAQRTYNGNGEIQNLAVDGLMTLNYSFDAGGRISGVEENGTSQSYEYAGTQLIAADTLSGDYEYQYDNQGNRVLSRQELANGERTTQHYRHAKAGDGNRLIAQTDLVSGSTRSFRYDANGSPIAAGVLRYEYNLDGRPMAIFREGKLIARYSYNSFGERIKKVSYAANAPPQTTYFLYDGNALTAEIDEHGDVFAQYVYLNATRPVLKLEGDEAYAIHTDHLGTPRMMSDKNGVLVWSAHYSPFGKATVLENSVSLPLRLPGQYMDAETGTHYNYLRDYDPSTGRYLTSDPIGLNGGINTYVYAANNPIGLFDSMGLAPAAEPLDGGGWLITAQQYSELAALANAGRRTEYYFMLHDLSGSRLAFEMAQISSNSEFVGGVAWNANYEILYDYREIYPSGPDGAPDIQTFSDMIFNADFAALEHFLCGPDGPIYRLPSDSEMVQVTVGVWRSVGLEYAAPPLVREFLDFYGDVRTQAGIGLGDLFVPERYEEAFDYVRAATFTETFNANGFYEPEFIRDHPGDVIETSFAENCLSKVLRAPVGSRDSEISEEQLNRYNDVAGPASHDVIVVLTSASEYSSCLASR